ncbi:MAG: MerR family transcriptional regulator [Actinomycetes bacterium]
MSTAAHRADTRTTSQGRRVQAERVHAERVQAERVQAERLQAERVQAERLPKQKLHSIGEVLAELKPEFPDLSHSKLRFLEDRGLVTPERTASGYRKFRTEDVERLRLVLGLQRDHYMPLKAIAEYLDAVDRGLEPPELPGTRPRVPHVVQSPVDPGPDSFEGGKRELRLRRDELAEAAGADADLVKALEVFGLVAPGPSGYFDAHDVEVTRAARDLAEYGIEPRHLRAFRTAADRELGLVEQVTAPLRHHRGAGSPARADEVAREISALCVRLHAGLVRAGLSRFRG